MLKKGASVRESAGNGDRNKPLQGNEKKQLIGMMSEPAEVAWKDSLGLAGLIDDQIDDGK